MRDNQPVITDDLTVSLLAFMPALCREVIDQLRGSPEFMDILGEVHFDSGALESISIHFWTPNKIIHDLRFRNGDRFSDLCLKMAAMPPEATLIKMLASDASFVLGHPIFEGRYWQGAYNDAGDMFKLDIESDITLRSDFASDLEQRVKLRKIAMTTKRSAA